MLGTGQAELDAGRSTATRAFLFTDIESSTRRWEGDSAAMAADLARHDALLRAAVERHGGRVMSHTGDGLCADFAVAAAALAAAVDGQLALAAQRWAGSTRLRVRMAVHVGAVEERAGNYFGPTLNRTARLMSVAAGGQTLCSQVAAELSRDPLPGAVILRDLGEHRLADLSRPERVYQVSHPELTEEFAPLRAQSVGGHNLPTGLGRFLGRETELAELEKLLAVERLVTLWGPGGAGKTRLSMELGARVLPEHPDGVWYVELAPLDRGELVVAATMSALGMLAGGTAPSADLCRYLTTRQLLLVLDNCEHVLAATAELAHAVLTHCPGVRIVASSRELLGVGGERAWPVPSLSVPPAKADLVDVASCDAVALFCERAVASKPDFVLSSTNAAAVAEICRRLDGIPLALELAASRVRVLGVGGLVARLDDRFGLLTGGPRTADARHQTLRAAVDWSYEMLSAEERALLAALSVFPGSFDLAAAQAVGASLAAPEVDLLDLLVRLVDKSLVATVEDSGGEVRYRMLETIRQYAAGKLAAAGLTDAMRRRHLDHYLGSPITDTRARFAWEFDWIAATTADYENFRAALDWAIERGDAAAAVRLTSGLFVFWSWDDNPGARDRMQRVLSLPELPGHPATAEAMAGLAVHTRDPGLAWQAVRLAESSGDEGLLAWVGFVVSEIARSSGDAGLSAQAETSLRLSEAGGFTFVAAWCHFRRTWQLLTAGDPRAARAHAERGLALCPSVGGVETRAHLLAVLALSTAVLGEADRADALAQDLLDTVRGIALGSVQAMGLTSAAGAAAICGRWARAESLLRELIALLRRHGTGRWAAEALEYAVLVLAATGRPSVAAELLRAADGLRDGSGAPVGGEIPQVAAALAECRDRLPMPAPDLGPVVADRAAAADAALRLALRALDSEPIGGTI